jgi:uncharacterized protein
VTLRGQQRIGAEFKSANASTIAKSTRIAMHDLNLDALYVVYPGLHRYPMGESMEAVPLWAVLPAPRPDVKGLFGLLAGRSMKVATINEINR